jgi:hypothetical protein
LDTDNDGTVEPAEAKAAASKLFKKLDRDHDGTLDRGELRGRMISKTSLRRRVGSSRPEHRPT